ncbi:MAG TPA: hypothetical protein VMW16_09975 [Sedimentisphaerales bacterium]|nr:hypothetical protein [Sedimentisphaerales bacterium]
MWKRNYLTLFIISLLISHTTLAIQPSASDLVDKYTQALDSTKSFIEHYEKTTDFSWRLLRGRSGKLQDSGKSFTRGQIKHDDQRIYCQEYNWGDFNLRYKDLPKDKPYYRCNIADGRDKKIYSNNKWINDSKSSGSAAREPYLREEKVSLSRHFGISYIVGYIGSDERLDAILRKADRISVRKKTQNIRGSECFVIDADTKCGRYSVWLDPEHGYHPAKIRHHAKEGEYNHSHLLTKGETASAYLNTVRFEKIDDIWVPMDANSGCYNVAHQGQFVKEDYHYKRTQFILNPDHDKLGSFADPILEDPNNDPELRNGTPVRLRGVPTRYTWRDGKVVDANGAVIIDGRKGKK